MRIIDSCESTPIDCAIGIPTRIKTDAKNDPFKKIFLIFITLPIWMMVKVQKEQQSIKFIINLTIGQFSVQLTP